METKFPKTETAYFAMGCFWGPQLLFSQKPGIINTKVGYMGGEIKKFPNPSYEQVCSKETGYAETIEVEFDNKKITYNALLDLFFQNHNPTQKDRQHYDIGTQYRSAIFYTNQQQKDLAEKSKDSYQKNYTKQRLKIVTEITEASKTKFYPAEEYHQNYLSKRGIKVPTCHS